MKKLLITMTILMLAFACAACGKSSSKDSTKEQSTTEKIDYSSIPDITIERATVTDGVLENSTLGIAFPVTDNMEVFSDSDIASRMAIGNNMFTNNERYSIEEFEDAMHGMAYDVMISIPDIQSAITITYNNARKTDTFEVSVEEFTKTTADSLLGMSSPKYTLQSTDDVKLGNYNYKRVTVGTDRGMCQRMYIRREANYFIQIVVTYADGNEAWADQFEASFIAK